MSPDNLLLQRAVDLARHRWFSDLPPVKARFAIPSDSRYTTSAGWHTVLGGIVIHPTTLKSPTELTNIIKHELIHYWDSVMGEWDEETKGHGEDFLKKAIELNVDLTTTFKKYPKSLQIYQRLTLPPQSRTPKINRPLNPPKSKVQITIPVRPKPAQVKSSSSFDLTGVYVLLLVGSIFFVLFNWDSVVGMF